jgi:hypothetical protein
MGRRDVDWLAVFTDPSTRLGRPASDIIVAPRIFLEDDEFSVLRCGLNHTAHETSILTVLSGHFF